MEIVRELADIERNSTPHTSTRQQPHQLLSLTGVTGINSGLQHIQLTRSKLLSG